MSIVERHSNSERADGHLLNDTFHSYTWSVYDHPATIDAITRTYDAFDRLVEQNISGTNYETVYTPSGGKLGVFNGSTIQQAYVPLPGGAQAEYAYWGLSNYRHADWLGSDRMETDTTAHVIDNDAYAPFGEPYAQTGNGEISFTGQNKDTDWLQYDFLFRQYDPKQGRWISPDPAGTAAVNPGDPQSWNRYGYANNRPTNSVDPLGLYLPAPCDEFVDCIPSCAPGDLECLCPVSRFCDVGPGVGIDTGAGGGGGGDADLIQYPHQADTTRFPTGRGARRSACRVG